MMIHYSHPQSRGMRTQVLLDYYNLPHRTDVIDFRAGEHLGESYLAVHPYGRVPALVDGDLTIVESGAITLYLADKYADTMGTPAVGTKERTRLHEWLFFFQTTLESVVMESFGKDDKTEARQKIHDLLLAMTSRYQSPHALGETLTLLDIIIACELVWYKMAGLYPDGLALYDRHLAEVGPKIGLG